MGSRASGDESGEVAEWQTECAGLGARLGALRRRALWADCSLTAGGGGGGGEGGGELRAHRVLLAAASPVFAAMLYGPLAAPHHTVRVDDLPPRALHLLIEYIYTDNIEIESCEIAHSLYYGAQKYMMPHLQTVCRTYILENVTPQNALASFEFAELFGEDEIRELCLQEIRESTHEVLENGKVEEAAAGTLAMLTALQPLALSSELELLRALEWHALAHAGPTDTAVLEDGNAQVKPNEQTKPTNGLDAGTLATRDAIKNIRFLTMDPKELAEYDLSPLLTESEILAITMNLLSSNARMPMPAGFSTSRECRLRGKRDGTTFKFRVQFTAAMFEERKERYHLHIFHIQNVELVLCAVQCGVCYQLYLENNTNNRLDDTLHVTLYTYCDKKNPLLYKEIVMTKEIVNLAKKQYLDYKFLISDLEEHGAITVQLSVCAD